MATHNRLINNVVVLGATGNVGIPVVNSLAKHPAGFTVTAVTRSKSKASFPANVQIVESDLSESSLRQIFKGQDAVVSCMATSTLTQENLLIDLAVEAGVSRFIPSEYGLDSTHPNATESFPVIEQKIANHAYIRKFEDRMSWTTLITGSFFDFKFWSPPASFGFNFPENKATVYDGGNVSFETTTLAQIGEAIASILSPEHIDMTRNEVVYVNSFTTTQNDIVKAVEDVTGKKVTIEHDTTAALRKRALEAREKDPESFLPVVDLIRAATYEQGGINQYSQRERGLWNERLGLAQEDLGESVRKGLKMG